MNFLFQKPVSYDEALQSQLQPSTQRNPIPTPSTIATTQQTSNHHLPATQQHQQHHHNHYNVSTELLTTSTDRMELQRQRQQQQSVVVSGSGRAVGSSPSRPSPSVSITSSNAVHKVSTGGTQQQKQQQRTGDTATTTSATYTAASHHHYSSSAASTVSSFGSVADISAAGADAFAPTTTTMTATRGMNPTYNGPSSVQEDTQRQGNNGRRQSRSSSSSSSEDSYGSSSFEEDEHGTPNVLLATQQPTTTTNRHPHPTMTQPSRGRSTSPPLQRNTTDMYTTSNRRPVVGGSYPYQVPARTAGSAGATAQSRSRGRSPSALRAAAVDPTGYIAALVYGCRVRLRYQLVQAVTLRGNINDAVRMEADTPLSQRGPLRRQLMQWKMEHWAVVEGKVPSTPWRRVFSEGTMDGDGGGAAASPLRGAATPSIQMLRRGDGQRRVALLKKPSSSSSTSAVEESNARGRSASQTHRSGSTDPHLASGAQARSVTINDEGSRTPRPAAAKPKLRAQQDASTASTPPPPPPPQRQQQQAAPTTPRGVAQSKPKSPPTTTTPRRNNSTSNQSTQQRSGCALDIQHYLERIVHGDESGAQVRPPTVTQAVKIPKEVLSARRQQFLQVLLHTPDAFDSPNGSRLTVPGARSAVPRLDATRSALLQESSRFWAMSSSRPRTVQAMMDTIVNVRSN